MGNTGVTPNTFQKHVENDNFFSYRTRSFVPVALQIQSPYVRGWWRGGSNHRNETQKKWGSMKPFLEGEQGSDRDTHVASIFVRHESRQKPRGSLEHQIMEDPEFVVWDL